MLRFFREHLCANNAWVQWKARPCRFASSCRAMKLPGLCEVSNWKIRHERLNDLHEEEAPRHQKAPSLVSLANWCKLMQIVSLTFCSFAHCAHFPVSSFITTTCSRCVFRQLWEPFCFGGGPAPCASDVYAVFTSFSSCFQLVSIRFTGKKRISESSELAFFWLEINFWSLLSLLIYMKLDAYSRLIYTF